MKKIIILIISILLLSGCYDYTEIEDIKVVTGILLDYIDNEYVLTIETLNNEKESKTVVYKTKCINIDSCILKLSKESNKELFISHQKVLVLTSRTINKSIDFYDYFLRNAKSKMNFYIYYINDTDIDNLFKDDKENVSLYLKDMTDFNVKDYSTSIKLSFMDMIQKIIEKEVINIYPSIIINDNKPQLDSLVFFNDKMKPIKLSNEESIIYNILSNNTNTTSINIPCKEGTFSLNIDRSKTKYVFKNNDLNINIKENTKLSNYNCKYNLNDNKTINKLENLANSYIRKKVNELIQLSINNSKDFIGIKRYIYKHTKKNIEIQNINMIVNPNIKITSIGESR